MDKTNSLEETRSKIKIYLHDSRKENGKIKCNSVDMIFTSPPYLNNFDYGEALKVLLYFWKFSQNWPDITNKIRKPAIIAATTHYLEKHYSLKTHKEILGEDFLDRFPASSQEILDKMKRIKKIRDERAAQRTKSFDILAGLYFKISANFLMRCIKS
jgi:DNA modification methylase